LLGNEQNDFSTVTLSNTGSATIVDANALNIASIEQAAGDVALTASDGRLTLENVDYRIGPNKRWTLASLNDDVILNGRIDSLDGQAGTGSLTVLGGSETDVRFTTLVGSQSRLDEARFESVGNVVLGLNTDDGDFEDPSQNSSNDFLIQQDSRSDIFFTQSLELIDIEGQAVVVLPTATEFVFDFEDQYFGVNIADEISFDPSITLDLTGQIGTLRTRAAGLSAIGGPLNGNQQFNNCLVGDPNSCSTLNQANVLRLVDFTPDDVFVLDTDKVEQLFLSFGNEELWGLPSVFAIDIEDDEEEGSEETQQ